MPLRSRATSLVSLPLSGVGDLVGKLMGLVHRRSAGSTLALMNAAGLTMAQMVALYVLDHLGPQSVTAIAAFLNLSPAATSHLVDRLVTGGFVGRTEDQEDRRQKRIAITPTGRGPRRACTRSGPASSRARWPLVAPDLQQQFARILGRRRARCAPRPELSESGSHHAGVDRPGRPSETGAAET